MYIKIRAEQQEVSRIFNAIICWTHGVCGISWGVDTWGVVSHGFKFVIMENGIFNVRDPSLYI